MRRLLLCVLLTAGFAALTGLLQTGRLAAAVDPHAYFNALSAYPNAWRSYSLRDQAQLTLYKHRRKDPDMVTYGPSSDPYPERQDAAKIVIEHDSLRNQVHLPLEVVGGNALITWDAWWGREYVTNRGELNLHKTFQISSPWDNSQRLFEVRNRYNAGGADAVSEIDVRSYGPLGPSTIEGNLGRIEPLSGTFVVRPATWTRYYVYWESVPNGFDRWSLWVTDETQAPVQVYDRAEVDAAEERLTYMRLEFNSSQTRNPSLGPLVAYVRNLVVLRNVADPRPLFQRPLSGESLPALPQLTPSSPRNLRILPEAS